MNIALLAIVLVGSNVSVAADLTCNELVLLRVILRQDLAIDAYAARVQGDDLAQQRAAPLALVLDDPNERDMGELRTIAGDTSFDEYRRFNAARALAYLGGHERLDVLSKTARGDFAVTASSAERSKAGLCLLYLESDLPDGFAFSRLPNPLYSELDAFVTKSNPPTDTNTSYAKDRIAEIVSEFVGLGRTVEVRGPLSVGEVELEALVDILCSIAQDNDRWSIPRLPFGYIYDEWQELKSEVRAGDLIYFFTSDEESWGGLYGIEGYVLIRSGEVVAMLVTAMS